MANYDTNFDLHQWIHTLRPIHEWKSDSISTSVCFNSRGSSLHLCVKKSKIGQSSAICFSVLFLSFTTPPPNLTEESHFQDLWVSEDIQLKRSLLLMSDEAIYDLFINLVRGITRVHEFSVKDTKLDSPDIFNLCFLTWLFLVVESHIKTPNEPLKAIPRSGCLPSSSKISEEKSDSSELLEFVVILYHQLNCRQLKDAQKLLFENMLESNLEVKWLRSVNSATTSCYLQFEKTPNRPVPTSLSRSFSIKRFLQVELYCPLLAMKQESSHKSVEKKLLCSLYNHQLEAVIQIDFRVGKENEQVNLIAQIDNVRINVVTLDEEKKPESSVKDEKHFPSRISLILNPICQGSKMTVGIAQSSRNPTVHVAEQTNSEFSLQTALESSITGPKPSVSAGMKITDGKTVTKTIQAWEREQYANNDSKGATTDWVLYGGEDRKGKVFSSKPSKKAHPWFSNRDSSANTPFNGQGGVTFGPDTNGQCIRWRMDRSVDSMDWEIKGKFWLTYWRNKLKTSYWETRSAEFREVVHVDFTSS